MSIKSMATAVAFLFAFAATDAHALTNCQKNYASYAKAPGHKAFATTLGNDPGYHPTTCWSIVGFTFKRLAEKKAVAECNRVRRPEDGGPCKVINSE